MLGQSPLIAATLACVAALGVPFAVGQSYPDHLIKIIVPFAPGGPVDVVARLVAQRMAAILGQNVIVENRAGGGGVIGAKAVANAEPALLFGNVSTLAVIPAVARNKDYDPAKNFAPVAKVSDSPEVLVVDRSFPVRTVRDLVTIAKNNPGKLNFGSSGFGNATHLAAEWFKAKTAVDIVHVPYKGLSEVVTGVLAGQVTFVFDPGWSIACSGGDQREAVRAAPGAADHDRERRRRLRDLELPGCGAPAGTPPAVVARLNAAVNASMDAPEMRAHLARLGATPATGTPQEFAVFFAAETRKWAAVVKSAGITID
jgi:tripartite-type tricarboxylate transporter receptor subunit TctC